MNFPAIFEIKTEDQTISVAKEFSSILKEGDIVTLNGNLGAGKTFFTKEVCKSFGIINSSSPSFAIVNQYDGLYKIYHFDFYRIKKEAELIDLGFEDYINDLDAICFIEWSNMYPNILPAERYEVTLKLKQDNTRELKINKYER